MADSVFLDEVVGFLHNFDDPTISGNELIQSLDKEASLLSLPGTEMALQLLDVTAIDGLFSPSEDINKDHHGSATDSDCTSVETESVASSSSPHATEVVENVRSRDAIRRSTYRQKQKEQRDDLYKQVEDLSIQLTTLQKEKEAAKAKEGMGMTHTAVWKALANRHLQAKLIAEEQRRRLHEAVERRSTLIRDLGVLVRKRIGEEQPEGAAGYPAKKPHIESPDMALYEAYIKELDEIYSQTDNIFKINSSEETDETQGFYTRPRRVTKDSSYHELVGKSSTPFAFDRVRVLIDRVCCLEGRPGRQKIKGAWIPENTTVLKSRIVTTGSVGSLVQHNVTRKYYEGDRVVVVWRKFTEGEGAFAGMHSDETGWNVVRPSPRSVEGCAGTLLESVTRFVPINFSSAASGAMVKQFTDAIIKIGEEDCKTCFQMLEELLLDDALGVC